MKKFLICTALVTTVASTGAAFAQTSTGQAATGQTAASQTATGMFRTAAIGTEIRASNVIGMRVYAAETDAAQTDYAGVQDDWNDLGEINDVILSREGAVEAVLVDIGGFLGIGARQVALNMDSVKFVSDSETDDPNDFFLVIAASQAHLESAPDYSMGAMGHRASGSDTAAMTNRDAGADKLGNAQPGAVTERSAMQRDGYMAAPGEALTAEALTRAAVYDSNDKWIGDVSDLTLTSAGKVEYVIVDVGGFLGIGKKPVALSLDKIDILRQNDGDELRVYLPMAEDELESMPTYTN